MFGWLFRVARFRGSRSVLAPCWQLDSLIGNPQFPQWQRGFSEWEWTTANRAKSTHTHRTELFESSTHYLSVKISDTYTHEFCAKELRSVSHTQLDFKFNTNFNLFGINSSLDARPLWWFSVCPLHNAVFVLLLCLLYWSPGRGGGSYFRVLGGEIPAAAWQQPAKKPLQS